MTAHSDDSADKEVVADGQVQTASESGAAAALKLSLLVVLARWNICGLGSLLFLLFYVLCGRPCSMAGGVGGCQECLPSILRLSRGTGATAWSRGVGMEVL